MQLPVYLTFATILAFALTGAHPVQQSFMATEKHGDIWSLCDDPSTHLLRAYEDGVYISPATPRTGEDINVRINGHLCKLDTFILFQWRYLTLRKYLPAVSQVEGGKVDIDLKLLSMIKVKKELDLCSILQSDVMGHKSCPLEAGDLVLEAKGNINPGMRISFYKLCTYRYTLAFIPREIPKLPLDGRVLISDQSGITVTCIHLNFNLQ